MKKDDKTCCVDECRQMCDALEQKCRPRGAAPGDHAPVGFGIPDVLAILAIVRKVLDAISAS